MHDIFFWYSALYSSCIMYYVSWYSALYSFCIVVHTIVDTLKEEICWCQEIWLEDSCTTRIISLDMWYDSCQESFLPIYIYGMYRSVTVFMTQGFISDMVPWQDKAFYQMTDLIKSWKNETKRQNMTINLEIHRGLFNFIHLFPLFHSGQEMAIL